MISQSLYVNFESLAQASKEFKTKVAIIARPDWFLNKNPYNHIIVETKIGIHNRCFLTKHAGIPFIIIYGRFDRIRSTSQKINFLLTQETLSSMGIETIVGTFTCGSIKPNSQAGDVYILNDLVGMGGYDQTRNMDTGFRNVDMLKPFCAEATDVLIQSTKLIPFKVHKKGIYVCFHGYPRIETEAELNYYAKNRWDVVGQTADIEATLAREAGCHYVGLAATIDDRKLRARFLAQDPLARTCIDNNIITGRKKTFDIFLAALPKLSKIKGIKCNCREQKKHVTNKSTHFEYLPDFMIK
ncbi:MAG: hypothetical protein WC621_02990 [Patescibacteria group bacterium]